MYNNNNNIQWAAARTAVFALAPTSWQQPQQQEETQQSLSTLMDILQIACIATHLHMYICIYVRLHLCACVLLLYGVGKWWRYSAATRVSSAKAHLGSSMPVACHPASALKKYAAEVCVSVCVCIKCACIKSCCFSHVNVAFCLLLLLFLATANILYIHSYIHSILLSMCACVCLWQR